jgi:hypothetical protein
MRGLKMGRDNWEMVEDLQFCIYSSTVVTVANMIGILTVLCATHRISLCKYYK